MPKKKIQQLINRLFAVMLTILLASCALTQIGQTNRMRKLLKDSGFKMRPADTPEKLSQIKQLSQREFVAHQQGDKVLYIYADADHCQCVYTGDEEAYRRYQSIADEKPVSEKDRIVKDRDRPARMDWGEWRFSDSW